MNATINKQIRQISRMQSRHDEKEKERVVGKNGVLIETVASNLSEQRRILEVGRRSWISNNES